MAERNNVKEIAQFAIEQINRLAGLVGNPDSSSSLSKIQIGSSVSSKNPNAVEELQNRFPTVGSAAAVGGSSSRPNQTIHRGQKPKIFKVHEIEL